MVKMQEPTAGAMLLVDDENVEQFKAAGFVVVEDKPKATRSRKKPVEE